MLCPRCEQGDIVKVRVVGDEKYLYVCQECEASWFLCEDIGIKSFFDYGGYMKGIGRKPLWSELEIIHE